MKGSYEGGLEGCKDIHIRPKAAPAPQDIPGNMYKPPRQSIAGGGSVASAMLGSTPHV